MTFQPIVLQPNDAILFQGDSITDAFRKPDELNDAYRLGNGYAFLIASQLRAQRIRDDLRFDNRGVSGDGIKHLQVRWANDCLDLKPDVLSVLIGINDTVQHFAGASQLSPDEFGAVYCELLQSARAANPSLRLVLCEPFVLPCGMANEAWLPHLALRQQVVRELARQFEASLVPLQKMFEQAAQKAPAEYWIYDGIHPTAAGHYLMAQAWLEQMQADPV